LPGRQLSHGLKAITPSKQSPLMPVEPQKARCPDNGQSPCGALFGEKHIMQGAYGCNVQIGPFLFANLTNGEFLASRPKPRYQIVIARFALKAFRSMQTFAATKSKKELTSWGALGRRQAAVRRRCAQERLRKVNFCETEPPGQPAGRRWGGVP
jgi:hypothetical protein